MFKLDFKNFKSLISKKTEGNNKRSEFSGDSSKLVTEVRQGDCSRNKKNIENLVVFLILLIITIIAINTIWGSDKKENKTNSSEYKQLAGITEKDVSSNNLENDTYNLENKLEDILSKMSGVR